MYQDLKGGAQLTGNLLSTYNSLGNTRISGGSGLSLTGSNTSASAFIGNNSDSDLLKNSIDGIKQELEESRQTTESIDENSTEIVVPNIYKYLVNVFDSKVDTLVGLTASIANYSVVDSFGTSLNTTMKTIMGGTSAVVTANPVDDTLTSNVASITENVNIITQLLQSVIANGSVNVSLSMSGSIANNVADQMGVGKLYRSLF